MTTSPQTLAQLVLGFVRRHARAYASAALMLLVIAIITVWIPRQVGHVIDGLAQQRLSHADLLLELAKLVLAGGCVYLLRVGWRLTLFAASYQLGRDLRTRLYRQMTLQGPRFFQRQRTGDLMALATNDIDAVEMAVGEAMLAAFDGSLTLLLVLAMMLIGVDWRLALAALLPFPLMALSFWYVSEQVHQAWKASLERFSTLNQHVQDSLSGVRTLRALGLAERSAVQFSALADHAGEAAYQAQRWEAAYEPAVGMTLGLAMTIALGLGGWLVSRHELSIGQLTAFTMYLGQLIWPMFAAGWVLSLLERGRAGWGRLQPVLDAPATLDDHGQIDWPPEATLHFDRVDFAYPEATQPALHEVSLALAPGQTLGLVGPTGAGKSTVLNLLLRQFEPSSGQINLAAPDARTQALTELRLAALRRQIAWVPQEPFLFSATIADNIALARPDATREQIQEAARLADVHDDVMGLPQGYDTLVGERGVSLSGGQRQRVAIARALLSEAPILLLDDALSAVDTGTEARILGHLRELRQADRSRSLIVVSHRLSAVMDADHVVVLRKGRICEQGRHDELLAHVDAHGHAGWYATQWRYQQLEMTL